MGTTRFLLLLALPMLALAGCGKDGIEPPMLDAKKITFNIGFAGQDGQTRVATDAEFKSTWEEGDRIGIFAVASGQPLAAEGNYIHNVPLTYSGGVWSLDPGAELWWPTGGAKLDFYAYSPYSAEATDPTAIAFNVLTDQSGANYNASDLLTAESDNSGAGWARGETMALTFSHALAMVQVTVSWPENSIGSGGELRVTMQDVPTGFGASAAIEDVTMHRVDGGNVFRALVPPHTLAAGRRPFRIELGEQVFIGDVLASEIALTAGRADLFEYELPLEPDYAAYLGDNGFRTYCVTRFDTNNDGALSHEEVLAVTRISYHNSRFITGLSHFRNLTTLDCSGNESVMSLDLTGLTELTELYCDNNNLTALDLTGLTKLTYLSCWNNPHLRELDLSVTPSIDYVVCGSGESNPLNIWVTPSESNEVDIHSINAVDSSGNQILVTEKGIAVNGVTVLDKP